MRALVPEHPPGLRTSRPRRGGGGRDRRRAPGRVRGRDRGAQRSRRRRPREERGMNAQQIIRQPIISEKSYALIAENKYTFRVNARAHKTQIRTAVEEIFNVRVVDVRTM